MKRLLVYFALVKILFEHCPVILINLFYSKGGDSYGIYGFTNRLPQIFGLWGDLQSEHPV